MAANIFAAYYPFDTLDIISKLKHPEKLAEITKRLKEASTNIAWAAIKMGMRDYIGFFAVPEYYFLKKYEPVGEKVRIELYDEAERDVLFGKLAALSSQYERIVILPGTISWRRPIGSVVKTTVKGAPVDIRYDGFSSAPVFYRGDLVHSYDKVMNDGNIDRFVAETRFVPGTKSPLFEVGNLSCGLEICGDFNEGNLAKATGGARPLDFEFMMSGSNYHMFGITDMNKIPVRNGGYFLHVDQNPKRARHYNGVWCVSRGSGWHSVDLDNFNGLVVDPWTTKNVTRDKFGIERSVGSVVVLKSELYNKTTSGIAFPGRKAFSGLRLAGTGIVTKALDRYTDTYEVTLNVELTHVGTSQSEIENRTIDFKAKKARVRPNSAQTDDTGKASAIFTCQKNQPAQLIAEFHGAKVQYEAKIGWVGPGEVTKMSSLKGVPFSRVPTFSTPLI